MRITKCIKYYALIHSAMLLGSVALDAGSPSQAPVPNRNDPPYTSPSVSPQDQSMSDQEKPKSETPPAPASQTISESLAPYLLGVGIPATSLVGYVIYKHHKEKTKLGDLDLPLDDKNTRSEKVHIPDSIYLEPPMTKELPIKKKSPMEKKSTLKKKPR